MLAIYLSIRVRVQSNASFAQKTFDRHFVFDVFGVNLAAANMEQHFGLDGCLIRIGHLVLESIVAGRKNSEVS